MDYPSAQAKTIKKAQANLIDPQLDEWQGKWFPHAPGEVEPDMQKVQRVHLESDSVTSDEWAGKWFPHAPGLTTTLSDNWLGKWFPHKPDAKDLTTETIREKTKYKICDDGVHNLGVDYEPSDVRQNYNFLCLSSNHSAFDPSMAREALQIEYFLPSAFMPPTKCLQEPINYTHQPPTNGAFRPLPAVYGSYKYLPPQRYLRNLAEGAIVMLYHPCAYQGQVEQLKLIVRSCLYRHIITPSPYLTPERPLALLSWSNSLTMSVVDKRLVTQFIKEHARNGPLAEPDFGRFVERRTTYNAALLTEAHLVTDLDDSELCGYQEM
ncbi:uncharacterized protein LOC115622612 [Scaptodrosophila lebanonensis]|uniref:Uncharacterized protein LOC115622612 n=1 Tax=Drosophila lebanonensis TaxID=7225 RepID=A0A6J2TBI2_DROLE|nr:uncharacterized protein LOC115622612 [Scaptodrosophila lebanonensis]